MISRLILFLVFRKVSQAHHLTMIFFIRVAFEICYFLFEIASCAQICLIFSVLIYSACLMVTHRIPDRHNPCPQQDLEDVDHSRRIIDYFMKVDLLLFFISLPL